MQLSYIEEASFGTLKSGSPLKVLRFLSESLHQQTSTTQSSEIRSDRQVTDVIRNNISAAGGVNFELSHAAYDDLFKASLMSDADWSLPKNIAAATLSAAAADNSFNDSGAGFLTAGFAAGMTVRVSGFATAANNGLFRITTAAAGKLVVTGGTLSIEAAGAAVTIARPAQKAATTIAASSVDNSITDSGNGFVTAGFTVNEWVKLTGFATAVNNDYFKIVSVVAGKIVLTGGLLTTEAAGATVTVEQGSSIVNGTTAPSYNFEKKFSDLTTELSVLTGLTADQMQLSVTPEAIVTGSFSFVGKDETSKTATAGSGYTAAPTNPVMNAVDNVLSIVEGGADFSAIGFTAQLQNNLRTRMQIGALGTISIGKGKVAVSGTLRAYYTSKTIMDKYLNMTASSLGIALKDSSGNAYILDLPRLKYTSGQRLDGGQNQDIIADMAFTAYMHSTETVTLRMVRFFA